MSCPVGIKLHAIAGWDGDRLVHTERIDAEHPGQRQITHTVYEPESFTPLLRLSTATKQQGKPNALVQALGAGLQDGDEDDHQALVMMQAMLGAMPKDLQDSAQASMQQALQQGLPPSALAAMPDEGKNTLQRLSDLREQLEKQEQSEQTPIEVLYFHCDHLGTPLALTDPSRNIVWAAQLDPWGNVLQEYNPQNIEQPIRLPGQHHDRETGLYYNRHRYYDPSIGSYINQDPIGLTGGLNKYLYTGAPLDFDDPLGLQSQGKAALQSRVESVRAGGSGIRAGGAKISAGKVEAKITQGERRLGPLKQNNAAVKGSRGIGYEIGKTCGPNEVAVGPTSWKWWEKKLSLGDASVSVQGPGISLDPICIDPEQVVRRAAAEAVNGTINNSGLTGRAADALSNRQSALDSAIEGASK